MIADLEALRQRRQVELPPPAERKAIREAYGVSQGEVAQVLNVSRLTVSQWERGQTEPKPEHARKYADLLTQMKQSADNREGTSDDQH